MPSHLGSWTCHLCAVSHLLGPHCGALVVLALLLGPFLICRAPLTGQIDNTDVAYLPDATAH